MCRLNVLQIILPFHHINKRPRLLCLIAQFPVPSLFRLRGSIYQLTPSIIDPKEIKRGNAHQYRSEDIILPIGDGKNDIFRPVFAGAASTFRFAVYDRWGRAVFVTSTPGAGWDGTTGGRPQPAGAYVWECVYQLYQEPERMQRGTVMLIR